MRQTSYRNDGRRVFVAWVMALAIFASPLAALAQGTRVEMPKNKYDKREDVQAGQQAVVEVERQLPLLRDQEVVGYVNDVGQRLVAAIPAEFQHAEFRYTFGVVNMADINAFALPGGPMYVNRGMIQAARNEGEMAGVMAHEISHVALRHATAQATGAQKYQIGSVLGQIAGAVIGGVPGAVIAQGTQAYAGIKVLKYSRNYETQADILGAQIMARAGYDPRDLANMFRTIEQQSGARGGPEWMSSHPNPGNRYARINQEAQLLRVSGQTARDSRQFQSIQSRLRGMGRAPTAEEVARGQVNNTGGGSGNYPDNRYPDQRRDDRYPDQGQGNQGYGRVQYPSARYRAVGGQLFRMSVPDNWREFAQGNSAMYVPEGGYGNNGITHGVMIGTDREQYTDLNRASQQYVQDLLQGNPHLRQQSNFQRTTMGGRTALTTTLAGRSPVTNDNEIVTVVITNLRSGDIFFLNAVAPQSEYRNYQRVFQQILRSVQLAD